jgi:hypothetical protein
MKLFDSNRATDVGIMAAANTVSFGSGLRSFFTQLFDPSSQLKMCECHGLDLMGHQHLLEHHNTNHWWHKRGRMKLFVSNRCGWLQTM